MKHKYSFILSIYFIISIPIFILMFFNNENRMLIQIIYFLISAVICIITTLFYTKELRTNTKLEKDMLYSILDDTEVMLVTWSENGSEINVNDCFIRKTNINPNKVSGNKILTTLFGADINSITENLSNKVTYEILTKLELKDNKTLTILWKITNSSQDLVNPVYMSVGIDVSATTEMASQITTYQNQLSLSTDLAEIGLIYRVIGTDYYIISDNLIALMGFEGRKITIDDFSSKIHPDDREIYDSCLVNNETSKNLQSSEIKDIKVRFRCADNEYHWYCLRFKISAQKDCDGNFVGGCMYDISADKEKDSLIEKMAYVDDVTQISNRYSIMNMGLNVLDCIKDTNIIYYLLVFDIDSFHIVNNICGYDKGDYVLKSIAIKLLQNMTDDSYCARLGGDSFAILITEHDCSYNVTDYIKKIQNDISSIQNEGYKNVTISASCGYYRITSEDTNFSDLLEHAEFAARINKERNSITPYDMVVKEKIINIAQTEKELEHAIDNNELVVYYQPKISLVTGKVSGAEALIRWIKPDGRIIPPSEFIPLAEKSMLITKISNFVLNETCKQIKEWEGKIKTDFSVSINLTSVDFYQTDVSTTIKRALETYKINPKHLEIELTEGIALKDIDHAIKQMDELKSLGIDVSLDDFGTGYSSLSYIKLLPIALLKLDRSFIINMEKDEVSKQIVYSVINICKSKHVKIVAEGIETKQQAQILKSSGCDIAQGFYFGKPMPYDKMEKFIDDHSESLLIV